MYLPEIIPWLEGVPRILERPKTSAIEFPLAWALFPMHVAGVFFSLDFVAQTETETDQKLLSGMYIHTYLVVVTSSL